MNDYTKRAYRAPIMTGVLQLLALFCLLCSMSAQATAPRIVPKLFGEERRADIVGYQAAPQDASARAEIALIAQLVSQAFAVAGKPQAVDVLPSRQLAKYALLNKDAQAMIGSPRDVAASEQAQYRQATFYFGFAGAGDDAAVLILSAKNPRVTELLQAFNAGLQKLIKSGKYLELLEQHHGKGKVPADYFSRLKHLNPGLK